MSDNQELSDAIEAVASGRVFDPLSRAAALTFDAEQTARLTALVAAGHITEAQRLILDELKAQDDSDE